MQVILVMYKHLHPTTEEDQIITLMAQISTKTHHGINFKVDQEIEEEMKWKYKLFYTLHSQCRQTETYLQRTEMEVSDSKEGVLRSAAGLALCLECDSAVTSSSACALQRRDSTRTHL